MIEIWNQRSPLSGYHWSPDEGRGCAGEGEESGQRSRCQEHDGVAESYSGIFEVTVGLARFASKQKYDLTAYFDFDTSRPGHDQRLARDAIRRNGRCVEIRTQVLEFFELSFGRLRGLSICWPTVVLLRKYLLPQPTFSMPWN